MPRVVLGRFEGGVVFVFEEKHIDIYNKL